MEFIEEIRCWNASDNNNNRASATQNIIINPLVDPIRRIRETFIVHTGQATTREKERERRRKNKNQTTPNQATIGRIKIENVDQKM